MILKPGMTLGVLLACCIAVAAWDGSLLRNSFDSDREGWQAYDYNGGIAEGEMFSIRCIGKSLEE